LGDGVVVSDEIELTHGELGCLFLAGGIPDAWVSSTLIAAGGRALEFLGTNQTVSIFQSHVDVPTAFVDTAAASTLTCAALSTPAAAVASGCI